MWTKAAREQTPPLPGEHVDAEIGAPVHQLGNGRVGRRDTVQHHGQVDCAVDAN